MKRILGITIAAAFVLGMSVTLVMAQEHVPAHKEQVCHKGEVLTVGAAAVQGHLNHGDCFIDKRTKLPPVFTGDECDPDADCSPRSA